MAECATCVYWQGDEAAYIHRCIFHDCNTSFNNGCKDHKERQLIVKAGEKLDEKIRDYNNMRIVVNGKTLEPIAPITFCNGLTVKDLL
jgi:hypothetical protein